MKVITILFIFINFCEILSLKIPPDNFKELDNPYRNDIEITTEKDHHIITAVSPKGYVDYYKGIYYKNFLFCRWQVNYGLHFINDSKTITKIDNYLDLQNIEDTNLKELLSYGCDSDYPLNVVLDYRRDSEENCNKIAQLDESVIAENSFTIYSIKLGKTKYYIQSEDFLIEHNYPSTLNWDSHIRLFFLTGDKHIYINSYLVSVDLFNYVLSLGGHTHNYCTNHGCITGTSCERQEGTSSTAPKYYVCEYVNYGRFYTECSLFGCIPGSFCDESQTCKECDYQCRTCFSKAYMDCKSCYSIAEYPQWKHYYEFQAGTQCTFEFYPINKIESDNIDVPIPLSHRVTMEFWMFIHDPKYLTNKDLRSSLSSFILKDFFTLSLRQEVSDYNSVTFILTPFEYFYPFKKAYTTANDYLNDYLVNYPALQYLTINVKQVTSRFRLYTYVLSR